MIVERRSGNLRKLPAQGLLVFTSPDIRIAYWFQETFPVLLTFG